MAQSDRLRPRGRQGSVVRLIGNRYGTHCATASVWPVPAYEPARIRGLGVIQLNAGLSHLTGAPVAIGVQIAVIAATLLLCAGLWRSLQLEAEEGALAEPDIGEPLPSKAEARERELKAETDRPANEPEPRASAPPAGGGS